MTTGRINQVTIVRRGTANRPYFRAEEFSSYWAGGAASAPRGTRGSSGCGPISPRTTSAFPFYIPQSAVGWRAEVRLNAHRTPPKRPKRRPKLEGSAAVTRLRQLAGAPVGSWVGIASG